MARIELCKFESVDPDQFVINFTGYPTARGMRYEGTVTHKGLMKNRSISSADMDVLRQKVLAQIEVWDALWKTRIEMNNAAQAKENARMDKEQKKEFAAEKTSEAQKALDEIRNTLAHTLSINDAINWESLKSHDEYKKPQPKKTRIPSKPDPVTPSSEPQRKDPKFQPDLNLFDYLFKKLKEKKICAAEERYQKAHKNWSEECLKAEEQNKMSAMEYNERVAKTKEEYEKEMAIWEQKKQEFYSAQNETNAAIEHRRGEYQQKNQEAITDYCDMVLSNSIYPDNFPKQWEIDYNSDNKILIIEYQLPSMQDVPNIKEVRYVQTKDDFNEIKISDSELNRIYDDLIYQITLRTIHELYEANAIDAIDSIVFNGWVEAIDKATGKEIKPCIVTVQASKKEFLPIKLDSVDPKACFKMLKGVGSSKLYSLTPIAPLIQISREDKRFVDSYAVADGLSEEDNLAAMDWEDFEHLIRELFEKEFKSSGGEVKVTQASRDGGVDAVAFDPDPIRGGKIVIQAKRYTNVVGVSAVRDLYGTVLNEGATKGLLVSTADYGPDAYEFAKGKPLTLLNGNNLLHLLQKHGHKAKIDLQEAKKILAERG